MNERKIKIFFLESLNEKIKLFFGQEYFKNRIVLGLLFFGFFVNIADWLALKFFLHPAVNAAILHYNVYFGVDSMGEIQEAYIFPFIGVVIMAVNFFLSLHFYLRKERIGAYLLLMTTLMAQLSLLISIISVIVINY